MASITNSAGALGLGDRGAYSWLPSNTGNPYDSQDMVYRWRQYVKLYETSWEARKIVRIVPEDALRKEWIAEDIPEEFADKIQSRLEQLRFGESLKRSLMLERLLGGCLQFMGVESENDETASTYKYDGRVTFCNAIPVSRISRVSWDTNPLSAGYMRPEIYLVNGQQVHKSRCLVWDGEPLFDPYDFALTNFRANISGFGPSKLASIWDDIIRALGTRQAAYQLVQTNNAILMKVTDLQGLDGTRPGKNAISKLKELANNLSVYRAALFDGDKADISQHSASFGSVPELLMSYLQVVSAGSDIPATRFIGQAPGGLNATGESDLENYYNTIDAYQRQRIEPNLRKMYDFLGYEIDREGWKKARKDLHFEFPPLWNASELEEAQKDAMIIDNLMKLRDADLVSDAECIREINAKGVLSIDLDDVDEGLLDEFDEVQDVEEQQPKGVTQVPANYKTADVDTAARIKEAGGNPENVDLQHFSKGLAVEGEHKDTVGGR